MKNIFRTILITVLTAVICLCGYKLFEISWQYAREAQTKGKLIEYRSEATENQPQEMGNQFIIDLQNEVNEEIVGWLTIPGTGIDYPFAMPADNSYYLKRDLYGNYAAAGSIFMDKRCTKSFTSFNTILYGHNMKNNSMFGDLRLFADECFFEANLYGTVFLKEKTLTLKFFAFMVVKSNDAVVYEGKSKRDVFYEYIKKNAHNFRDPVWDERVVTLSTCSYEYNDARIVLIANVIRGKEETS